MKKLALPGDTTLPLGDSLYAVPSEFKGDMRPVEKVSYNDIRGSSEGAKWPASSAVDGKSFMGRLRTRTKLDFDLPTEAQWEYACRAGTTSEYNNGGNSENDLKQIGRYRHNRSDGRGGAANHTVIGAYMPNRWGLYDMHGNVWEWCCDWRGDLSSGVKDPKGSSSGDRRVLRGGSWVYDARLCRSARTAAGAILALATASPTAASASVAPQDRANKERSKDPRISPERSVR